MADHDDALQRIDTLAQVGFRLAGQTPSGRIVLAKIAEIVEPDWVPEPWDRTLWPALVEQVRRSAPAPLPLKMVESVLADAWGVKPSTELDSLDPDPVAVTESAQIHRAVLDGATVAVKVLRPGVDSAMRQDLSLLDTLAAPLRDAFPGIDPAALVREARERALDELDLEHQAAQQRRIARAVRGVEPLVIPNAFTALCHEHVLVTEWAEGIPLAAARPGPDGRLSDPDALRGVDLDAVARTLVRYVIGGLREGLLDADLDPNDVLISPGRITIVDFGGVTAVDPARCDAAQMVVEAFAAGDGARLGAGLAALGMLPAALGNLALSLASETLGPLATGEPARLDSPAFGAACHRLGGRVEDFVTVLLAGGLAPPDLWPARGIAQLFATIIAIGATADWRGEVLAALREGWRG